MNDKQKRTLRLGLGMLGMLGVTYMALLVYGKVVQYQAEKDRILDALDLTKIKLDPCEMRELDPSGLHPQGFTRLRIFNGTDRPLSEVALTVCVRTVADQVAAREGGTSRDIFDLVHDELSWRAPETRPESGSAEEYKQGFVQIPSVPPHGWRWAYVMLDNYPRELAGFGSLPRGFVLEPNSARKFGSLPPGFVLEPNSARKVERRHWRVVLDGAKWETPEPSWLVHWGSGYQIWVFGALAVAAATATGFFVSGPAWARPRQQMRGQVIVIGAAALLLAMCLVPPQVHRYGPYDHERRYLPIWDGWGAVDVPRLALQVALVVVASAVARWVLRSRRAGSD